VPQVLKASKVLLVLQELLAPQAQLALKAFKA